MTASCKPSGGPRAGRNWPATSSAAWTPKRRYAVTDLDTGREQTLTGRELMDDGLPVTIQTQPGAVVLTYKQLK